MIKYFSGLQAKAAFFFAMLFATSLASAAVSIDSTEIVSAITGVITVVSAVGMAVISLVVTIKLFQWVKQSIR